MSWWCLSGTIVGEMPDRNTQFACFVGEIGGDAGAGKRDDAHRQRIEHLVVALERRSLAVTCPIRLEDDLRNLAVVGPTGGDALGAARAPAVQQNHVAVF